MDASSTASTCSGKENTTATGRDDDGDDTTTVYRCLVLDSGVFIKSGGARLFPCARAFYTVPAVMGEIRDAKARQALDQLPYTIELREPSRASIDVVTKFAHATGDSNSLSGVDVQVLALAYELELEGCHGRDSHLRKTPKRMVGLGKFEKLSKSENIASKKDSPAITQQGSGPATVNEAGEINMESEKESSTPVPIASSSTLTHSRSETITSSGEEQELPPTTAPPRSWASLLQQQSSPTTTMTTNPILGSSSFLVTKSNIPVILHSTDHENEEELGGQFSDAESSDCLSTTTEEEDEEAEEHFSLEQELMSDFPSLAAAATVPYEGEDDDNNNHNNNDDEERKRQALQPVSKSGKFYNSFRKYSHLMQKQPKKSTPKKKNNVENTFTTRPDNAETKSDTLNPQQSRIMGGMTLAGQTDDVEDDGEGWITTVDEVRTSFGGVTSTQQASASDITKSSSTTEGIPPISLRTACATTDFAMQNVLLQMNLELVTVDGMKVRKLKNWVTRCGACFAVYTSADTVHGPLPTKRLFCERCGSDFLQRIAASVDGKTGRVKLHLSKKYRHNLRGTKFSLPKPGSGNRFQGDLLLREDQLLTGAWNQKVKMRSGGKSKNAAQSMFGRDLATTVGCHAQSLNMDDIRVGFGRQNPNAAKGRERRGKKKKSTDKACGLRRY
jgi:RNA-binding protein NOB1